jgi:ferritin
MKRLLSVIVLIVVVIFVVGFFLPREKTFSQTINSPIPFDGISRVIVNKGEWKNWWPGKIINDSTVRFNDQTITIHTIFLNGFKASITEGNRKTYLDLQSITTYNAETAITLNTTVHLSSNPFIKVFQYLSASSVETTASQLLDQLKNTLSDVKKVYGFDIKMGKVPNSSYVSVKQDFDHYPDHTELYKMIDEVKTFILSENSKVMNDPILNIVKENDRLYTAMVAVASDKDIPTKGKFMLKQMMLGNIVVAQVTGGPAAIEKCRQAVQFYVNDFRKTSPAIAFERMISHRLTTDSTRWVTTINYPVFQ